jgi:cytochrome d ubiquinol oxidase subunit I
VQGLLLTRNAVSPTVSTTMIAVSLGVFVLLYGVLAVVDLLLMLRFARRELPGRQADGQASPAEDAPVPAVQY